MPLSLAELQSIIRAEWSPETAWTPEAWRPESPAAGQCFSTAHVVKSLFGGEIVHAEIIPFTTPRQRHAWNRLPSGLEFDLTREQFSPEQVFLECELPADLVWQVGGVQAALLFTRVESRLCAAAVKQAPNHSIERTSQSPLRALCAAAHVGR